MDPDIRSQFPAASRYTYLNSAAVAPLPVAAIDAIRSQLEDVATHGSEHFNAWVDTKNRARALVASMLCVRPDQIAFTRNTSDGLASVAAGIDWSSGDNIVSFAEEFPSNFYPWRRVRDKFGVELRLCPERDGRIDLDEFVSLIGDRTRLVAISAVQFGSGFRANLEFIGRAADRVGAIFSVDIIQALGAQGFDLPKLGVDVAAGASHKWLCAPEGCGILYISDRARKLIDPSLVGWISVETPWDFADREQPWKSTALAWESGTGCSSLFYGLEQSLKLLTGVGLDRIETYLDELSGYLCESLADTDFDIVSSRRPGESSPIVCIESRSGKDCSELAKSLAEQNVIVSPRNGRLRIAPHLFNTREDIDVLVSALR